MTAENKNINIKFNTKGNFAVEAIVAPYNDMPGISAAILSPDAGASFSPSTYSDDLTASNIINWGSDNNSPKNWRLKLEKSTTAFPLLWKSVLLLYGLGLTYYREKRTGTTIEKDFTAIDEVDQFISDNDIDYLMIERLMDFKFFNNCFCEVILSTDRKKIVNINHLEAEFSRFVTQKQADGTTVISSVQYEGDWQNAKGNNVIDFYSKDNISLETLSKNKMGKFVMHSCFPVPGRAVYGIPPQIALYASDSWLDFSNSIPGIMNSINKNVMDIRYHIQIPYEYWPSIYPNWTAMTQDEQTKIIDDKLTQMQQFLSGKNSGNSFISHFATDPISGKPLSGWVIEEIGTSDKKDKFLTSVQESDTQIVRALNLDVSLAGIQPAGGKMGAGSGSDKRTAFSNQVSLSAAEMLIITEPLRIVQRINNWDSSIKWAFTYDVPTTLNDNPNGTNKQIN